MTPSDPQSQRISAAEKIANELRTRIAKGLYAPHSYLPSLRTLATEFNAGLQTVSAATERLMQEGITVKAPGRGTRVLPPLDHLSQKIVGLVYLPATLSPDVGLGNATVLEGIQQTLQQRLCRYELVNSRASPPAFEELRQRFGALISVGSGLGQELMLKLDEHRIPYVAANLGPHWNVTATIVDHRKTTQQAVQFLASMGHRRIACIVRSPAVHFYGQALEGYITGLEEAGITHDESLVIVTPKADPLSAYAATRAFLSNVSSRPTAIVAAADYLAHGSYEAFSEAGFVVGRDFSLIGYDDVSWPEEAPFLTTFKEPSYELGVVAAEMLMERIVRGWCPPEKRELRAPFIVRRSVGPILDSAAAELKPACATKR